MNTIVIVPDSGPATAWFASSWLNALPGDRAASEVPVSRPGPGERGRAESVSLRLPMGAKWIIYRFGPSATARNKPVA